MDRPFQSGPVRRFARDSARHCADVAAVIAMAIVALGGCSKPPAWEFDELDATRAQLMNEVSLGHYEIPIPMNRDRANARQPARNRLQFDFELYAVVPPQDVSEVTEGWERREGLIRDRVIRVCRNASLAELQEPELSTLKARLMDALQDHLGAREVRRLLMTDVVTQEL